jgi:hypothetical protein
VIENLPRPVLDPSKSSPKIFETLGNIILLIARKSFLLVY